MRETSIIFRKFREGRFSIETLFAPLLVEEEIEKIELPCELNSIRNLFRLLFFSLKIKNDIIHISGDVHYIALFLFWKKIIITVHDLNYLESIKGIKKIIYSFLWFQAPLFFAKKIIVISPFTKAQLTDHFHIKSRKIKIIPDSFTPINRKKVIKSKRFTVLTIGSGINKNRKNLILAVQNIANLEIIFVGKLQEDLLKLLHEFNIPYINVFNISREKLDDYYSKSDLLFFASTKEGFGLPILEAQSILLPVITSTTTSMPYVAGDGALLVNPHSIDSIKEAILAVKNQTIDLNNMKNKGLLNTRRFTVDNFIKEYKKVYHSLAGNNTGK